MIRAITRQSSVTAHQICPRRLCGDRRGGDPDLPPSADSSLYWERVRVTRDGGPDALQVIIFSG